MNKLYETQFSKLAQYFLGNECLKDLAWKKEKLFQDHIKKMAAAGDVQAMIRLGKTIETSASTDWYRMGDAAEDAVYWYAQAAEAGSTKAMILAGDCCVKRSQRPGSSGPTIAGKDFSQALTWYAKAFNAGDMRVLPYIGCLYRNYGRDMMEEGWQDKALVCYEKAAENGDVNALFTLGDMYYYGEAAEKDDGKALQCYLKGVDILESGQWARDDENWELWRNDTEGIPIARQLALMYHYGLGTPCDDEKALAWYVQDLGLTKEEYLDEEKAAADKNIDRLIAIAQWYDDVKKDHERAAGIYDRIIDIQRHSIYSGNGPYEIMQTIGDAYKYGKGWAKQDYDKALSWYERSLDALEEEKENGQLSENDYIYQHWKCQAYKEIGDIYYTGDKTVPKDYGKARQCFLKLDGTEDMTNDVREKLALMYSNGWGVARDDKKAEAWFLKECDDKPDAFFSMIGNMLGSNFANRDIAKAMIDIGCMYELGRDVPQDSAKAEMWYGKAREYGRKLDEESGKYEISHVEADVIFTIGGNYEEGIKVPRNFAKALTFYGLLAEEKLEHALAKIGDMYYTGDETVAKDDAKALHYYEQIFEDPEVGRMISADSVHDHVAKRLGDIYYSGSAGTVDYDKAIAYYSELAYVPEAVSLKLAAMYEAKGDAEQAEKWRRYYDSIHIEFDDDKKQEAGK